jgi:hypothetical protein
MKVRTLNYIRGSDLGTHIYETITDMRGIADEDIIPIADAIAHIELLRSSVAEDIKNPAPCEDLQACHRDLCKYVSVLAELRKLPKNTFVILSNPVGLR